MSAFTTALAKICQDEYIRWDNGAGHETWGKDQGKAKDYYLFVKDYWKSIGNNALNGRTLNDKGIRPPWSAAFVSFCVKKAGASDRFKYAEAHRTYIHRAMQTADDPADDFGYRARRAEEYKPRVGDIVCAGREGASHYDYDKAKSKNGSGYSSHGDIVVEVTATECVVIGGNVKNNVDMKRLPLSATGHLMPRSSNKKEYPWIAILECRL